VARTLRPAGALAVLGAVLIAAASLASHSSQDDSADSNTPVAATDLTLTAAQEKRIHLQTVQPSTFHKSVEVTGTVDFDYDQATTVLTPIGGPVSQLLVSLGQQVKADQPLASVDSPDFAAAISTYRKAIYTARINRQIADLDKQLVQHRAIAQRDVDQAELNAVTAEADRQAALAALVSLKVDPQTIQALQESQPFTPAPGMIRSPVAGTVVEKLITPGELLSAGATPCFTVADLSRVWVMAHLFGADLGTVSTGDSAQVLTGIGSQSFPGTVDNISAMMDPDTRSLAVRVQVSNPKESLKKGMYVRVRIESHRQISGLLLPVSAILRDEENLPFVYVAQGDGHFARHQVTLGYRVDDRYDITAGVAEGDQVVVEGGLFVQFMENQ
jgi:cobalt-zinc-cadmium efflux system membrane fusion protein